MIEAFCKYYHGIKSSTLSARKNHSTKNTGCLLSLYSMALFYLHRGSMGWGLKEFREIHVSKPPAFAPIHSFHGTTWPWSLSPWYSWKLLFVKNCIKSETDKPKLERGYLQAISPTKDYASKYIKVYLPKETNWPNRNMDKRHEQTFTEERDPIKIWKKMKLTRCQK